MLERIPHLKYFSRAYWNQLGSDVHGNIEAAFRQFLDDASRIPDGGRSLRRDLYAELMLILDSDEYGCWVKLGRTNPETIKEVGGRFIMPEQVKTLLAILDEAFEPDS